MNYRWYCYEGIHGEFEFISRVALSIQRLAFSKLNWVVSIHIGGCPVPLKDIREKQVGAGQVIRIRLGGPLDRASYCCLHVESENGPPALTAIPVIN